MVKTCFQLVIKLSLFLLAKTHHVSGNLHPFSSSVLFSGKNWSFKRNWRRRSLWLQTPTLGRDPWGRPGAIPLNNWSVFFGKTMRKCGNNMEKTPRNGGFPMENHWTNAMFLMIFHFRLPDPEGQRVEPSRFRVEPAFYSKDKDQKLDIKEVVSLFFPDPRRYLAWWIVMIECGLFGLKLWNLWIEPFKIPVMLW